MIYFSTFSWLFYMYNIYSCFANWSPTKKKKKWVIISIGVYIIIDGRIWEYNYICTNWFLHIFLMIKNIVCTFEKNIIKKSESARWTGVWPLWDIEREMMYIIESFYALKSSILLRAQHKHKLKIIPISCITTMPPATAIKYITCSSTKSIILLEHPWEIYKILHLKNTKQMTVIET